MIFNVLIISAIVGCLVIVVLLLYKGTKNADQKWDISDAIIKEFTPRIRRVTTKEDLEKLYDELAQKTLDENREFIIVGQSIQINKLFGYILAKKELLDELKKANLLNENAK